MRFLKGHGTGNDFVLLPDPDATVELTPALVRALCDRHSGIGADGVLRVVPASRTPEARTSEAAGLTGRADWFMDHRNADGSLAEMCGNGLRLFAYHLLRAGLAEPGEQLIGTRAGLRQVVVDEAGAAIRAEMGPARLGTDATAAVGGYEFRGTSVSVGNPHLVCATDVPLDHLDLTRAPDVSVHTFPAGVNVEFFNVLADPVAGADVHVRLRVHERGVGETRACGTGACAVGVVALSGAPGTAAVDQPGGRVLVTVDERNTYLTGPAVLVGRGELADDWLAAVTG